MSTTTAKGTGSTQNDGGVVMWANAGTGSRITRSVGLTEVGSDGAGSRLVDSMPGVDKAQSGGTLQYMEAGKYVIRRHTTALSTVANSTLLTGASDYHRNLNHANSGNYTLHMASGFDYNTGHPLSGWFVSNDSFRADEASLVSRAVPGTLIMAQGFNPPTTKNYGAITGT